MRPATSRLSVKAAARSGWLILSTGSSGKGKSSGNFSQVMIGSLTVVDMVTSKRQAAIAIMRGDSCDRHWSKFLEQLHCSSAKKPNNVSGGRSYMVGKVSLGDRGGSVFGTGYLTGNIKARTITSCYVNSSLPLQLQSPFTKLSWDKQGKISVVGDTKPGVNLRLNWVRDSS